MPFYSCSKFIYQNVLVMVSYLPVLKTFFYKDCDSLRVIVFDERHILFGSYRYVFYYRRIYFWNRLSLVCTCYPHSGNLEQKVCDVLETFQKLELEKKKSRVHRQTYSGPVIRYHSVTVPVVDELSAADPEINVDSDTVDRQVDLFEWSLIRAATVVSQLNYCHLCNRLYSTADCDITVIAVTICVK